MKKGKAESKRAAWGVGLIIVGSVTLAGFLFALLFMLHWIAGILGLAIASIITGSALVSDDCV